MLIVLGWSVVFVGGTGVGSIIVGMYGVRLI